MITIVSLATHILTHSLVDISDMDAKVNGTIQSTLSKFEKRINRLTNICLAAVSDPNILPNVIIFTSRSIKFCTSIKFFGSHKPKNEYIKISFTRNKI